MKKYSLAGISSVLLVFFILSCTGGEASSPVKPAPAARAVESVEVKPVDFQEAIFASGRLSSREEIKLSFKTGGIVRQMHVREGQTVREGQLLAELDLDEIRAQAQQARLGKQQSEITIENTKLALRRAERDFRNVQNLYRDSVATLEQLEDAEIQLNNARNQLEAAQTGLNASEQNITVADFNLKYSRITAPSSGVILKRLAEANELVGPGTPVFLFGSSDKAMVIKVNITDKDIIHVSLDDEAEVSFDAYPGHVFRGFVREVASMADPYTGTYEVEIEVLPDGKKLLSGFIGTVNILTKSRARLLIVPVDALVGADDRNGSVFIIDNGTARRRNIHIARIQQGTLLVDSGLQAGDRVIITGVGYLEDMLPVVTEEEERKTASADRDTPLTSKADQ